MKVVIWNSHHWDLMQMFKFPPSFSRAKWLLNRRIWHPSHLPSLRLPNERGPGVTGGYWRSQRSLTSLNRIHKIKRHPDLFGLWTMYLSSVEARRRMSFQFGHSLRNLPTLRWICLVSIKCGFGLCEINIEIKFLGLYWKCWSTSHTCEIFNYCCHDYVYA